MGGVGRIMVRSPSWVSSIIWPRILTFREGAHIFLSHLHVLFAGVKLGLLRKQ